LRLLLDVQVSSQAVASRLREAGHDVLATAEHADLRELDDVALLTLAREQDRILVTFDVNDFPDILREWAEENREHAGCVMLVGLDHSEFGLVLRLLAAAFERFPDSEAWVNLPLFLGKGQA